MRKSMLLLGGGALAIGAGSLPAQADDAPAPSRPMGSEQFSNSLGEAQSAELAVEIERLDLGISADALAAFLEATPEAQEAMLIAAGFDVPAGDLASPEVQTYLRGQYLLQNGEVRLGAELIRQSGLSSAEQRFQIVGEAEPDSFAPSGTEVEDTALATGLDPAAAHDRAQLQNYASALRSALREADGGYYSLKPSESLDGLDYETSSDLQFVRDLLGSYDLMTHISLVPVTLSERELNDALERVAALPEITQSGSTYYADKDTRRVIVRTSDPSLSGDRIAELAGLDADLVQVQLGDLATENSDIVGGVDATISGGAISCTWGFTAYWNSGEHHTTAGHCGDSGLWYGFLPFGSEVDQQNSGDVDTQVMPIYDPANIDITNRIITNATNSTRAITSVKPYLDMEVGDSVCMRGATSGWDCGDIVALTGSQAAPSGGTQVMRTDIDYVPGDSGGPMIQSNSAVGTDEGNDTCGTAPNEFPCDTITHIEFAQSALNFLVKIKP